MNDRKYLSVGALTRYLKMKFDTDENLRLVFLKGEISNFKSHSSGHLYFSIKDETSKINAIMFSKSASKLTFQPADGMKILVTGRISIYEASGNYQIYVEEMLEDGVGNLYIAFEKLKAQLSKEGLFDPRHKKPIPKIPERIGIITAPTGAAIKDIISTIRRRFPIAETILFPSLVQGENAASDIVKNIKRAENYNLDLLIVGRGGGSIEDLWPFNEESVARTIFACPIPIISAVGHEIDYTISDFVADLRAPTPTGAAELAVPNILDLTKHMTQLKIRLHESIHKTIHLQKLYLDSLKNSFVIKNPIMIYENKSQKLDTLIERLKQSMTRTLEHKRFDLDHIMKHYIFLHPEELYAKQMIDLKTKIEKLELINPMSVLKRGFAIPYQESHIIKSIYDVKKEEDIKLKLYDGEIDLKVITIKGE